MYGKEYFKSDYACAIISRKRFYSVFLLKRISAFIKEGEILLQFINKYKHGLVIGIYLIIYMIIFDYLESLPVHGFHVVHTTFDDMIPFCEYFIIPYFLWFPYMAAAVLYFIFVNKNKREYYQLCFNLMMGMTVFLVVSYIYPNIQHLRPSTFARDNIFTDLVAFLYKIDTPTNILPSIHVFNSLAIHKAISSCEAMKEHPMIKRCSFMLTCLIILSTMFLKQHTVIDVCLGTTLALFGSLVFYPSKEPAYTRKHAYSSLSNHKKKNFRY